MKKKKQEPAPGKPSGLPPPRLPEGPSLQEGEINANGGDFKGQHRFKARATVEEALKQKGLWAPRFERAEVEAEAVPGFLVQEERAVSGVFSFLCGWEKGGDLGLALWCTSWLGIGPANMGAFSL